MKDVDVLKKLNNDKRLENHFFRLKDGVFFIDNKKTDFTWSIVDDKMILDKSLLKNVEKLLYEVIVKNILKVIEK
jgi:hypothetical protein